ncbi:hypothetical protein K440DRAFT_256901 [Wilcoxina mikolae CBS 423.85]|nr:hypothetical protein K440DRAFT_256901 [Wilcoxina mikolae CBS 423.85]
MGKPWLSCLRKASRHASASVRRYLTGGTDNGPEARDTPAMRLRGRRAPRYFFVFLATRSFASARPFLSLPFLSSPPSVCNLSPNGPCSSFVPVHLPAGIANPLKNRDICRSVSVAFNKSQIRLLRVRFSTYHIALRSSSTSSSRSVTSQSNLLQLSLLTFPSFQSQIRYSAALDCISTTASW